MKRYVFAILAIFILMTIGIIVLGGGSNTKKTDTPQVTQSQKALHEYADSNSSKVIMTTQGNIVGDDQFRSIRITVTRDVRRVEVLAGYSDRVEKSQEFPNTQEAFDVFLRALEHAGYEKTQKTTQTDERGVCPNGRRFVYETKDGSTQIQRTWSVSCGPRIGNFGGISDTVTDLFQGQITDYSKFVSGVRLS